MRPAFHFTPAAGWINDPHGAHHWNGEYHVFFQHLPDRTEWSHEMRWGHVKGPDLLSLAELPIAIAPGDDDGGVWTGSLIVDDEGDARIFYTSTDAPDYDLGRVRVATPDRADWVTWTKGAFVVDTPEFMAHFRDPWVFRDGDGWSMILSGRHRDGAAALVSYRSDDLEVWDREGVALRPEGGAGVPGTRSTLWECPQLFEIDGRHVLVLSGDDEDGRYVGYAVGRWADGRFEADHWGRLTFGGRHYAPTFLRDAQDRPALLFWLQDIRGEGWAGAHSIPYLLALRGDELVLEPHPDLERYRSETDAVASAADIVWAAPPGAQLRVAEVSLRATDDQLLIETPTQTSALPLGGDVRIVVDGPILEIATQRGVFGAQVTASGAVAVTGDTGARVFALARGEGTP
ncbi:glycoside hydrolase family 32 protein [Microbacterium sp. NPDC019599]|uniref:glycoside hydrolase family 32 protein n=1 Tax=Microbacterium sp. NPDC019599 TaxID=3154690 RepID=UPI00340B2634